MSVLLIETEKHRDFLPVSRNRFLWEISAGMFNALERWSIVFKDIKVYSIRFNDSHYGLLKGEYGGDIYSAGGPIHTIINPLYIPGKDFKPKMNHIGVTKDGDFVYFRKENISKEEIDLFLNQDFASITTRYKTETVESGIFISSIVDIVNLNGKAIRLDSRLIKGDGEFVSHSDNVFIHRKAEVQQYVSLQPGDNPIVIDNGACVRSFSIIDGPAYIGKNSVIDSAKIREDTTIKNNCKIGGEVEASVIEEFSNKHHEGFVGHSYIGRWVNIGALATTSDLKNNYGEVRLVIDKKEINTDSIKFGSIICDYSKIGIGIMLNTGSVIDLGTNMFLEAKQYPKYIKPFSWGLKSVYKIDRFLEDIGKMMKRRGLELSSFRSEFLREIYKLSVKIGGKNGS